MTTNKIKLTLAVVGMAVAAWLAFGFFGLQTAFLDDRVDEADPFALSTTDTSESEPTEDSAAETRDSEPAGADTANTTGTAAADTTGAEPTVVEAASAATTSSEQEPALEPAEQEPAQVSVRELANGRLVDHAHHGEGGVVILSDGVSTFLRFEDDFAIDNGPDLNVYLVRGATAEGDPGLFDDDFVDLGDLKGNIGAQNYEIPADVDLTAYDTVAIWCVRFGVAFNAADLVAA